MGASGVEVVSPAPLGPSLVEVVPPLPPVAMGPSSKEVVPPLPLGRSGLPSLCDVPGTQVPVAEQI
jgi:hypothetical protein